MENTFDFIEFRIDADKKLLYSKWLRDVTQQEYRAGFMQAYKLIEQHGIKLWIHNRNQLVPPQDIEDQKWLSEDFSLLLSQSTLQYMAIVCPVVHESQAILQTIRDKSYRIFGRAKKTEFFDTEQEALAWLLPNMQHYRLPDTIVTVKG